MDSWFDLYPYVNGSLEQKTRHLYVPITFDREWNVETEAQLQKSIYSGDLFNFAVGSKPQVLDLLRDVASLVQRDFPGNDNPELIYIARAFEDGLPKQDLVQHCNLLANRRAEEESLDFTEAIFQYALAGLQEWMEEMDADNNQWLDENTKGMPHYQRIELGPDPDVRLSISKEAIVNGFCWDYSSAILPLHHHFIDFTRPHVAFTPSGGGDDPGQFRFDVGSINAVIYPQTFPMPTNLGYASYGDYYWLQNGVGLNVEGIQGNTLWLQDNMEPGDPHYGQLSVELLNTTMPIGDYDPATKFLSTGQLAAGETIIGWLEDRVLRETTDPDVFPHDGAVVYLRTNQGRDLGPFQIVRQQGPAYTEFTWPAISPSIWPAPSNPAWPADPFRSFTETEIEADAAGGRTYALLLQWFLRQRRTQARRFRPTAKAEQRALEAMFPVQDPFVPQLNDPSLNDDVYPDAVTPFDAWQAFLKVIPEPPGGHDTPVWRAPTRRMYAPNGMPSKFGLENAGQEGAVWIGPQKNRAENLAAADRLVKEWRQDPTNLDLIAQLYRQMPDRDRAQPSMHAWESSVLSLFKQQIGLNAVALPAELSPPAFPVPPALLSGGAYFGRPPLQINVEPGDTRGLVPFLRPARTFSMEDMRAAKSLDPSSVAPTIDVDEIFVTLSPQYEQYLNKPEQAKALYRRLNTAFGPISRIYNQMPKDAKEDLKSTMQPLVTNALFFRAMVQKIATKKFDFAALSKKRQPALHILFLLATKFLGIILEEGAETSSDLVTRLIEKWHRVEGAQFAGLLNGYVNSDISHINGVVSRVENLLSGLRQFMSELTDPLPEDEHLEELMQEISGRISLLEELMANTKNAMPEWTNVITKDIDSKVILRILQQLDDLVKNIDSEWQKLLDWADRDLETTKNAIRKQLEELAAQSDEWEESSEESSEEAQGRGSDDPRTAGRMVVLSGQYQGQGELSVVPRTDSRDDSTGLGWLTDQMSEYKRRAVTMESMVDVSANDMVNPFHYSIDIQKPRWPELWVGLEKRHRNATKKEGLRRKVKDINDFVIRIAEDATENGVMGAAFAIHGFVDFLGTEVVTDGNVQVAEETVQGVPGIIPAETDAVMKYNKKPKDSPGDMTLHVMSGPLHTFLANVAKKLQFDGNVLLPIFERVMAGMRIINNPLVKTSEEFPWIRNFVDLFYESDKLEPGVYEVMEEFWNQDPSSGLQEVYALVVAEFKVRASIRSDSKGNIDQEVIAEGQELLEDSIPFSSDPGKGEVGGIADVD